MLSVELPDGTDASDAIDDDDALAPLDPIAPRLLRMIKSTIRQLTNITIIMEALITTIIADHS